MFKRETKKLKKKPKNPNTNPALWYVNEEILILVAGYLQALRTVYMYTRCTVSCLNAAVKTNMVGQGLKKSMFW